MKIRVFIISTLVCITASHILSSCSTMDQDKKLMLKNLVLINELTERKLAEFQKVDNGENSESYQSAIRIKTLAKYILSVNSVDDKLSDSIRKYTALVDQTGCKNSSLTSEELIVCSKEVIDYEVTLLQLLSTDHLLSNHRKKYYSFEFIKPIFQMRRDLSRDGKVGIECIFAGTNCNSRSRVVIYGDTIECQETHSKVPYFTFFPREKGSHEVIGSFITYLPQIGMRSFAFSVEIDPKLAR